MNKNSAFESLIEVTQANRDTLSTINSSIVNSNATTMAKTIADVMNNSSIGQIKQNLPDIANNLKSFFDVYSEITKDNKIDVLDNVRNTINLFQAATAERLKTSFQTEMISTLKESFSKVKYEKFPEVINKTLKESVIGAADFAFLKTPGLLQTFEKELNLPRGMKTSLDVLHTSTAEEIAKNSNIVYDTKTNEFIADENRAKSTAMNVICAGKKIFSDGNGELFSEVELIDFMSFLSNTLTMALRSETGRRIYDFLEDLYKSKKNLIDFDCNMFYHSRNRNKESAPLTADEMMKAPHGLPGPGRYNHSGRAHYYFSDKQIGAEIEVKKYKRENEITQTIKLIPVKKIDLLDLSGNIAGIATFLKYIRYPISEITSKTPREYLIPCFVADCCKNIGYEGIKYYGSKEYSNYVSWDDGYFKYAGMC